MGEMPKCGREALEQCWFFHSQAISWDKPLTLRVLHLPSCSEGGPELTPEEGLVHRQPREEGR